MPDYPIIDVHIHTYPRAELGWQAQEGRGHSGQAGTVDEYLALMREGNIRRAAMVNMTPLAEMRQAALAKLPADLTPAQRAQAEEEIRQQMVARLQRRNAWTCQVAGEHPQLAAFISVDPILMDEAALVAEVEESRRNGASGIKLHPANQQFYPNDRRLWPVYHTAQALGLPILSHSGRGILPGTEGYARPSLFAEALAGFPALNFVLAHLGWGYTDEAMELVRGYPNVSFDLSFAINGSEARPELSDEEAAALIRRIGPERVLFGSDWPWCHPLKDAQRIDRLPLTAQEKRLIFYENAQRILKL